MDIFAQKKLLIKSLILLVVLNITLLVFMCWKSVKPHHEPALFPKPDYRDVSGILKKELKLNDQQEEQFKKIRAEYYAKESAVALSIRNAKDSMNTMMFNKDTDETTVIRLAKNVADLEYQMELLRLAQANELKKICTPQQLEKFQDLVKEIRDYFRPDNQPPKKE